MDALLALDDFDVYANEVDNVEVKCCPSRGRGRVIDLISSVIKSCTVIELSVDDLDL